MHRWHQPFLGVRDIPAWLPQFEIEAFFTFDANELATIRLRRTTDHAFGLALQIGFLRMSGRCLNGVRMLPRAVLMHIGQQIGAAPPQLASLRALYSRTMTLHEHQSVAMQLLGFQALGERAERMLVSHLRRACPASIRADEMLLEARKWIYEHRYLIPNERRVLDVARRVVMTSEAALVQTFERAIPLAVRRAWFAQLQEPVPHAAHLTRLQWLQASPHARRGRSLDEAFMRVQFLYELGVHRCLQPEIAHEKLRGYALRLTRTKQSRFNQLGTATRTIALVAFLRLALYQSTDIAVELWLMRVTDLKRQAYGRAIERHAKAAARRFQDLVQGIDALDGACRSDKRWRAAARDLVERARQDAPLTKAAHMRKALLDAGATVRGLLRLLLAFPVSCVAEQPHLQHAIDLLRTLHARHRWSLPQAVTTCPFAPLWRVLVADSNRRLAFAAFEAATLLAIARGLRNGTVTVGHSLMHQRRESLFIPRALWQQDERFFLRQLDCSGTFSF